MNYAKIAAFYFIFFIMSICEAKYIEIQGHRGARGNMLENTLPAFNFAIEAGVDCLELDIVVTKDDMLIIYHDFFINPEICTNVDGSDIQIPQPLLYSLFLTHVKQFKYKTNNRFPRQIFIPETCIPTLRELFSMISTSSHPNAKKVRLNLEIKRDPNNPEYTPDPAVIAKKIMDLVQEYEFSERVYYSSFDAETLFKVRKLDPNAIIGYLKEDDLEGIFECVNELKPNIVSPEHVLIINREFIHFFQERGIKVIPWTVNDSDRVKELIEMGVDGIITDYPKDIIQHLAQMNLRTFNEIE